jgi:hypothetical protein
MVDSLTSKLDLFTSDEVPVHSLSEDQRAELLRRNEIFQMIIREFPCSLGKEVSKQERDCMEGEDYTLTYGEVGDLYTDFVSLGETFATIKAKYGGIPEGGVFYDLGSVSPT